MPHLAVDLAELRKLQQVYANLCAYCCANRRAGDVGAEDGSCADMSFCGTALMDINSEAQVLELLLPALEELGGEPHTFRCVRSSGMAYRRSPSDDVED